MAVKYGNLGVGDLITGNAEGDAIFGGPDGDPNAVGTGNDTLYGGPSEAADAEGTGNDSLYGQDGDDQLFGQDGDDILFGGAGADILDGGTGENDIADYRSSTAGVTIDLSARDENGDVQGIGGDAQGDTLRRVEAVFGSSTGGNTLTGNDANNVLQGGDVVDRLDGYGGDDILIGGIDVDSLNGGDDDDILVGGADGDTLDGGGGENDVADYRSSTAGVTIDLSALDSDEYVQGSGGDAEGDRLIRIELIYGAAGGGNTLTGDAANNVLVGGGAEGVDTLSGAGGDDVLEGGAGTNVLHGGDGIDEVSYLNSARGVNVNLETQTAVAADGVSDQNDQLLAIERVDGSTFGDTLTGDVKDNQLVGRAGNDTLDGGGGADYLEGGEGLDTLLGGAGDDTLIDNASFAGYTDARLDGGDDTDSAWVDRSTLLDDISFSIAANLVAPVVLPDGTIIQNIESITFIAGLGDDHISGGALSDFIFGGAGNDVLSGGDDVLSGDLLFGGAGNDIIDGGNGGIDIAAFNFAHGDEYLIKFTDSPNIIVIDLRPGSPDGTDTLTNVEQMRIVNPATANALLRIVAPTLEGNTVAENADPGAMIGTVGAEKLYPGDTLSYTLVENAGGRFQIDNSTGVLSVFNGGLLDYEGPQHVHEITVHVSDGTGRNLERSFLISVTDANDRPVANAAADAVAEDASVSGSVSASDADAGQTATLTYALASPLSAPTGLSFNANGS
jgi:Ca2+-binding RTX toxin-like protein